MLDLSPKTIFSYEYGSYKGFFAENLVLAELTSSWNKNMYSWNRNTAEIAFLLEYDNKIVPIEVKAGINTKAKSLKFFKERYLPRRSFLLSFHPMRSIKDDTIHLPLFMASKLQPFM